MNSLIVIEGWLGKGGVQTFALNLSKALKNSNINAPIHVYGKSSKEEALENGFNYFPGFFGLLNIFFHVIKDRPEIVYLNQPKALFIAPFLRIYTKVFYVVHIDADFFITSRFRKIFFRLFSSLSKSKILVMSKENITKLKKYGISSSALKFVRPPLFFKNSPKIKSIIDRKYDLIFYGRMANQKDPIKFLRICEKVNLIHKNLNVCIAGDGPLSNLVDDYISSCKFNITRYSAVDRDIGFSLLKDSRLFCMTSTHEGLGFTLIEAAFNGAIPVSGPISSGPKEIIDNIGLAINTINDDDYVNGIANTLSNNDKLSYLQAKSVKASTFYNAEKVVNDYLY